MTQISVDELLKDELKEKLKDKVIPETKPKMQNGPVGRRFRMPPPRIFNNPINQILTTRNIQDELSIQDDRDFSASIKDTTLKASSYTMKDEAKRAKFYNKLKESNYLNKYLDKKGMHAIEQYMNEDGKALAVYSIAYMNTFLEKE
jgi:hypothetical protein